MSQVFKCDRCGKLYNFSEKNSFMQKHTSTILKTVEDTSDSDSYATVNFELCKECDTSFNKWIKETTQ